MANDKDLTPMQRRVSAYAEETHGKRRASQYRANARARNAANERHICGESLAQYRRRCSPKPRTLAEIFAEGRTPFRWDVEPKADKVERMAAEYSEWLKQRDNKRSN